MILLSQIEHHPRVAKYAMENHSLREENRRLRLSEPVKRAQEMDAQTIAKLEKVFSELCDTEKNNRGTECPCLEGLLSRSVRRAWHLGPSGCQTCLLGSHLHAIISCHEKEFTVSLKNQILGSDTEA